MGHIQDLWWRDATDEDGNFILNSKGRRVREKTPQYGKGMRYKARYKDPAGNERSKSFADKEKTAAEDFLLGVENDKREGRYVDPSAGRVLFPVIAKKWLEAQSFDWTRRERVESRVRTHIVPYFEEKTVGSIRPSHVMNWIRWLQDRGVAPNSRALYFNHLVPILNLAVDEKRIGTNPALAKSVTRPREEPKRIVPWPRSRATAVREALPDRYKPAVSVPAGLGLRQGEVFGFSLDDVDRTKNIAHIVRQVRIVNNVLVFAPPKRRKTRESSDRSRASG